MFDPYKEHQIVTTGLGPANGNRKRRDSNNVIEQNNVINNRIIKNNSDK